MVQAVPVVQNVQAVPIVQIVEPPEALRFERLEHFEQLEPFLD